MPSATAAGEARACATPRRSATAAAARARRCASRSQAAVSIPARAKRIAATFSRSGGVHGLGGSNSRPVIRGTRTWSVRWRSAAEVSSGRSGASYRGASRNHVPLRRASTTTTDRRASIRPPEMMTAPRAAARARTAQPRDAHGLRRSRKRSSPAPPLSSRALRARASRDQAVPRMKHDAWSGPLGREPWVAGTPEREAEEGRQLNALQPQRA